MRKLRVVLSKRAGSAAGLLSEHVIISGGASTGFRFTNHLDVWAPPTDRQPQGRVLASAAMPEGDLLPERWQHSAVSWGGELLFYGGQDMARRHPCGLLHVLYTSSSALGARPTFVSKRVPLARCADDELTPNVELPLLHWPNEGPALTGHTARLIGGEGMAAMLCFGGKAPGGPITDLLWRVELRLPRLSQALPGETTVLSREVEWRLLSAAGTTPTPRYCHSAVELSRGWLVFGGWAQGRDAATGQLNEGTVFLNDLHLLELPAMSWSSLNAVGAVPCGRCQSVMAAARDEEIILVFGGACHHDPKPGQLYGDMVMDLFDVVLLHMPTLTWLPQKGLPSNYVQRGGTNTLIRTEDGRSFVFGGMNSDEGHDEPNFLSDLTELVGLDAGAQSGSAGAAAQGQGDGSPVVDLV